MTDKTIFACVDPANAHWQLGPLPPAEGRIILIGWHLSGSPVDSGVPEEIAAILANALTSIVRVSFPISETHHGASKKWGNGDDKVRSLGGNLIERVEAALRREPSNVALLSTRSPKMAARLFGDSAYPWRLQGQVAVLSALDAEPPRIDRKTLLSLIGDDWTKHAAQLHSCGIVGVLRPGVDGDIAGVLSLTDEFTATLIKALERAARLAKFNWLWLSENGFIDML